MSHAEVERRVLGILLEVAPDVNPAEIDPDEAFRDQFDFDSMDTLNFAIGLHRVFGIEIPENDYQNLASLSRTIAYVERRMAQAADPSPTAR